MSNPIDIRPLHTHAEIHQAEHLQKTVWGEQIAVPYHLLITAAHNGGALIGAFDQAKLVALVFSFIGLHRTESGQLIPKHCSHMLATLPEYRQRGLGVALKKAQRKLAQQQGINLITWTVDPLESGNAHINFVRLGGVTNTYDINHYGEMNDSLNRNMPSDRLQLEWWINTPRVDRRLRGVGEPRLTLDQYFGRGAEIINPATRAKTAPQFPHPPRQTWSLSGLAGALGATPPPTGAQPDHYLVEIPPDIQVLKAADFALALQWRLHIREILTDLFARGWQITNFVHEGAHSFYVVSREL